jgi:hypothetical protein
MMPKYEAHGALPLPSTVSVGIGVLPVGALAPGHHAVGSQLL